MIDGLAYVSSGSGDLDGEVVEIERPFWSRAWYNHKGKIAGVAAVSLWAASTAAIGLSRRYSDRMAHNQMLEDRYPGGNRESSWNTLRYTMGV